MNYEKGLKNKIIETVKNYFKNDSKKELLKNKDYETISNELVEDLFKDLNPKLKGINDLKLKLKISFMDVIKKYCENLENNKKVN